MKKTPIILSLLLLVFISCTPKMKQADLILENTQIYTVDDEFSIAECVVITDGLIVDLGTTNSIRSKYEAKEVLDLNGKFIYPGFIDAHCHFHGYGVGKLSYADLTGTKSLDEIIEKLKAHKATYNPTWILGRGWDQNDWEDTRMPTNELLNEFFPDNPVLLIRIDGHAALVNQATLNLANFDSQTSISGGELLQINNKLSGVLLEKAADSIRNLVPKLSRMQNAQALNIAEADCFSYGLTSVSDAGLPKNIIDLIDSMQQSGKLKMQIYAMLEPSEENFNSFVANGPYATDRLSVRSIKLYADGALGSRGACMFHDYSDDPHNKGLMIHDDEYYKNICQLAYDNNYQVNTHAIGDLGNNKILNIYADFLKGKNDRRWRIEHAQVLRLEDMKLFAENSIIPSVQATHATSDMYWAEERLGENRVKGAYAYQTLLKQNGWIANGTDFPIEHVSPIYTFYAATARKDLEGWPEEGYQAEEALTREQALRSITIWAAKSGFEEKMKGSVEIGKQADLVVLDNDIITMKLDDVSDVKVLKTMVQGEFVYEKSK